MPHHPELNFIPHDIPLNFWVRKLLTVDDKVSIISCLEGKSPVADDTAVATFFVHLHDMLQVLSAFGKGHLAQNTHI